MTGVLIYWAPRLHETSHTLGEPVAFAWKKGQVSEP